MVRTLQTHLISNMLYHTIATATRKEMCPRSSWIDSPILFADCCILFSFSMSMFAIDFPGGRCGDQRRGRGNMGPAAPQQSA